MFVGLGFKVKGLGFRVGKYPRRAIFRAGLTSKFRAGAWVFWHSIAAYTLNAKLPSLSLTLLALQPLVLWTQARP